MASIERRLERLKEQMPTRWQEAPEPWPIEDQLEDVIWSLYIHKCGRTVYEATDREIALLERVKDLPEDASGLYERMDPAKQPAREQWLYEHWESCKRWRELSEKRIAWHHEHGWDKPTPEHLLPGEGDYGNWAQTKAPGAAFRG